MPLEHPPGTYEKWVNSRSGKPQAGGPKRGKSTFCHKLARLLANVAEECKPELLEGEADEDFGVTRVRFLMEGDPRLPFQYTLLVRLPSHPLQLHASFLQLNGCLCAKVVLSCM